MRVTVEVLVAGESRPPAGAGLIVQVRDARLQDAPAVVVGEARATTAGGASLATVEIDAPDTPGLTAWAHVDVDGDGRVSKGDWVTVQSYPVPGGVAARVAVSVRRV